MSERSEMVKQSLFAALRKRDENGGRHLHHRDCIHNLPPVKQIELRGKSVAWWEAYIGPLPVQITPDDWQTDPPAWPAPVPPPKDEQR